MAYQSVFQRYELKYLLTPAQKELLTLLYRDGYTQSELAERIYHTSAAAISKRLARIHNRIICKFRRPSRRCTDF